MIADLALGITLALGPKPSDDGARTHRRQQAALYLSLGFLAEGVADCTQTKNRIFRFGTTENNKLTPPAVLRQFHRQHAGLCNLGFGAAALGLYLSTRKMDSALPAVPALLEGVNLLQQGHN